MIVTHGRFKTWVQPHLAQLWPNVVGIGVILQVVVERGAAGSRNGEMIKAKLFPTKLCAIKNQP